MSTWEHRRGADRGEWAEWGRTAAAMTGEFMQAKALAATNALPIGHTSSSMARARRVDLVVTDCERLDGFAVAMTGELQQEVQYTIPLAILSDALSNETLREAVRLSRPATGEPISSDEFLLFLERAIGALRRVNDLQASGFGSDADHARVERLTPRERQVLSHVVAGDPNKRTAAALNISRRTVEHHRAAIMQKTRTKSVSELVRLALRTGLYAAEHSND